MPPLSDWLDSAPLVIAHRGASHRAPENTLPAFELAAQLGADAVELDAKLSRDARVVAFHDQTLERTTGEGGRPGDRTAGELRRLEAGLWRGEDFRGTGVPEVREVLDAVGRSLLVNIELTDYAADQDRLAAAVVDLVRAAQVQSRVPGFVLRLVRSAGGAAAGTGDSDRPLARAHLVVGARPGAPQAPGATGQPSPQFVRIASERGTGSSSRPAVARVHRRSA